MTESVCIIDIIMSLQHLVRIEHTTYGSARLANHYIYSNGPFTNKAMETFFSLSSGHQVKIKLII